MAIPVLLIFGFFSLQQYRQIFPDRAFAEITGRALPDGIYAKAYSWNINDNPFHVGHYWLLSGSSNPLRRFTNGTWLSESDDARFFLPDMQILFGNEKTLEQVIAGFEDESPCNNWYWIFEDETQALYHHN